MGGRRKRGKGRWWICLVLLLGVAWFFYASWRPFSEKESFAEVEYLPSDEGELVRHTYYSLSFNSEHKQANWVYYVLALQGQKKRAERTDNFREDRKVTSGSAKPSDYTHSGYDRGHLCPAGDMAQSELAMQETFFMSNIAPQVPQFNRGIWKKLEERVRDWARREPICIATGPVFKDSKGKIGKSGVTVPGYFYKVLYAPVHQRMIAFLLPNSPDKRPLQEYVVTVDSVECLTNIDFFPQLADTLETRLEAMADYAVWN